MKGGKTPPPPPPLSPPPPIISHEAIKLLNSVRMTGAWGVQASEAMVDVYLSPDNDPLWLDR